MEDNFLILSRSSSKAPTRSLNSSTSALVAAYDAIFVCPLDVVPVVYITETPRRVNTTEAMAAITTFAKSMALKSPALNRKDN